MKKTTKSSGTETTDLETKRAKEGVLYMTFRGDCPTVYARAAFVMRYGREPYTLFLDADNGYLKLGPIPERRSVTL